LCNLPFLRWFRFASLPFCGWPAALPVKRFLVKRFLDGLIISSTFLIVKRFLDVFQKNFAAGAGLGCVSSFPGWPGRALACCATPTPGGGFDPRQAGAGECRKYRKNKKVWFIPFPPVGHSRAKLNFAISFLSRVLSKRTYRKNEKYPTNLISQNSQKQKRSCTFLSRKRLTFWKGHDILKAIKEVEP
jgi:hypothetical protein